MTEDEINYIEKTLGQGISFRARCIRKLIAEIKRLRLCMLDALGPLDGGPSTCCEGASAEFSYAVDALKRGLNEK